MTVWKILFYAVWCAGLYVHWDRLFAANQPITQEPRRRYRDGSTGRSFDVLG